MFKEIFRSDIGKIILVVFIVVLMILSMIYLSNRWAKIRDIRRQADAQAIVKALGYYTISYGSYPENTDDDGEGWDLSNEKNNRIFIDPVIKSKLLPKQVFDPTNDDVYFYRYQKFKAGDFGCPRDFVIFQISSFETEGINKGHGSCPDLDFTTLAPNGYTWLGDQ